jgi:hypothetical protein
MALIIYNICLKIVAILLGINFNSAPQLVNNDSFNYSINNEGMFQNCSNLNFVKFPLEFDSEDILTAFDFQNPLRNWLQGVAENGTIYITENLYNMLKRYEANQGGNTSTLTYCKQNILCVPDSWTVSTYTP